MASSSEQVSTDGLIDFSKYTNEQLADLQYTIDRATYPLNHENLLAELAMRRDAVSEKAAVENRLPVRFTDRDGIMGWLESINERKRLYGQGWTEFGTNEITLHGWRRTWLGSPQQTTICIPTGTIRNASWDGNKVRFEYGRRRMTLHARSTAEAQWIAERLPQTQTAGFEQKWAQLRMFNRALDDAGTGIGVTGVLVLANIFVFVALAIREKRVSNFYMPQLLDWGANYGPLTVNGQWWRLLAASFLHLDPVHLLVNMWAFWNVGRLAERLLGRWAFLAAYLSTAVIAGLTSIWWDPSRVSVGASGAIFGVFGVFLAYLVRYRSQIPVTLFQSHWFSTLAFVLFSLVSGILQTGVDNAAHMGGLLSGIAIGWFISRPLEPMGRSRLRTAQALIAGAVFAAMAGGLILQVRGTGSKLTELEKYLTSHEWYLRGEAENLRLWQSVAARIGTGNISNLETGYQFENNILPFWDTTVQRLTKEEASLTGEQARYADMLLQYARARQDWANAIISINKDRNGKTVKETLVLGEKADAIAARLQRIKLRDSMTHRPRALSNSTLVSFFRNRLLARFSACVEPPAYFHWHLVQSTDLKTDGPAMSMEIGCMAQYAFRTDDYSALEDMLGASGKSLGDLADGSSSLHAAASGLFHLFEFGARNALDDLGRIADWRRSYPDSGVPDLVEAMLYHGWAWTARGSGTSDTITPQMNALYRVRTEMAAAALEDSKLSGTGNPLWYQLAMEVGLDQSRPTAELRAIFDEGYAKFPEDLTLYRQMIRVLLPRWQGSHELEVQFINDMTQKAGKDRESQTYARLAWIYSDLEEDRENIFDEDGIGWPQVRDGFHELMRRYPESDDILNGFAKMACRADAVIEYVELRPRLKMRFSNSAWSDEVSLESCDKHFAEALKAADVNL
jgi:membrane associated rhomboid family serine protease